MFLQKVNKINKKVNKGKQNGCGLITLKPNYAKVCPWGKRTRDSY